MDGPREPVETDTRLPLRPMLGPDLESPTQKPLPTDLRLLTRNGMGYHHLNT